MSATAASVIRTTSVDRLVYTLFVVTLAHGLVILGISFEYQPPAAGEARPLEVALIREDQDAETPEDARFIAQADQRGASADAQARGRAELADASPFANPGLAMADAPLQSEPGRETAQDDVIVGRAPADHDAAMQPDASRQPDRLVLQAKLMQPTPRSAVKLDGERVVTPTGEYPDELLVSVDTKRSDVALYLQAWKAKIEQVGTLHFPDAARQQGLSGSPVLEVAVASDGSLRQILVVRPSEHRLLDQAALRILRLAAPFDAFPPELAREYQTLRFVYEWQFIGGASAGARMSVPVQQ